MRSLARLLLAPAVGSLFLWMIVPLGMTLYFSFVRYNLVEPSAHVFVGLDNFRYFVTDPSFWPAILNTLLLLGSVIAITVVGGILVALLVNEPFPGRGIVRVLLISPFFVMPTVNALLWKHMMMNPIYGVLAQLWRAVGLKPVDWLGDWPLLSVIIMVAWQWLPFAVLIFRAPSGSDNHAYTATQTYGHPQQDYLEVPRGDGTSSYIARLGFHDVPLAERQVAPGQSFTYLLGGVPNSAITLEQMRDSMQFTADLDLSGNQALVVEYGTNRLTN